MVGMYGDDLLYWLDSGPGVEWVFLVCFLGGAFADVVAFVVIYILRIALEFYPNEDFVLFDWLVPYFKEMKE